MAIARALANKPALILADEPTGNLDPATSETVIALLLEVAREENVAALIATHNMALAKRLHRAVTIRHGAIEAVNAMSFVHLRSHSAYSLLKGAIKIPKLIATSPKPI